MLPYEIAPALIGPVSSAKLLFLHRSHFFSLGMNSYSTDTRKRRWDSVVYEYFQGYEFLMRKQIFSGSILHVAETSNQSARSPRVRFDNHPHRVFCIRFRPTMLLEQRVKAHHVFARQPVSPGSLGPNLLYRQRRNWHHVKVNVMNYCRAFVQFHRRVPRSSCPHDVGRCED